MKITSTHIIIAVAVIGVGLLIGSKYMSVKEAEVPAGKYDALAQCISNSGAKFYGAFWCPHCAEQKALFGDSVKELPYIECSTPDKQNQTQVCIDNKITGYPTWELADGSRLNGVVSLEALSEKTNCPLE